MQIHTYAVAADIYGEGRLAGRGGWTWYTGSAGWLYRAGVEGILGLRQEGNRMHVTPALPSAWTGYSATLRHGGKTRYIEIDRTHAGKPSIVVDGKPCRGWFAL